MDFLGQGAFGEVYRSVGETSGTVVAVKLLPLGALSSPDSKIALLNEIRTAQQIRHPTVVQVLHVNDGTSSQIGPYVIMELAKLLEEAGLANGRSANLGHLKQGTDDLYGRWGVCEIGLMALTDPAKIIGRFGITKSTVTPFGFKDAYFYDQIRYATGGLHAFTYNFLDDVAGFFANLIHEACK